MKYERELIIHKNDIRESHVQLHYKQYYLRIDLLVSQVYVRLNYK